MARCLGLQSPHAIRVLVHLAHVCSLPHLGLCLLCTEEEEPWDLNSSWALTGEKYSCHTPSSSPPPPLPLHTYLLAILCRSFLALFLPALILSSPSACWLESCSSGASTITGSGADGSAASVSW